MLVIKDRDDYDKLKKIKETKKKLMIEKLEEKLSNQIFYRDMEKVFEPSIQQQKEITKAITTGNEDLGKALLQGVENYNQIKEITKIYPISLSQT